VKPALRDCFWTHQILRNSGDDRLGFKNDCFVGFPRTHVTSLGWQAIPMFEQLKFSLDFVVRFVPLVLLRVSQNLRPSA
jgi:hypothetical protein